MNFGSIYVEFIEPISFKSYVQEIIVRENLNPMLSQADQKLITSRLGDEIIHRLSRNLIIMPTSICASVLLMHRKGISEDELTKQVDLLISMLRLRKAILPAACNNPKICVTKGTFHLNETVGKKKEIFEPRVKPKVDYKNILLLSYYRNNLIHHFINEAFISCSLFEFGQSNLGTEGIDKKDLWEKVQFVNHLLRNEFVIEKEMRTYEEFEAVLNFMMQTNTLAETADDKVVIHPEGENQINYLNSLVWPFIDTYWVTFVFIFSLVPSKFVQEGKILEKIQWFAESLYEDQIITFYESCSQEIIKNSVSTYYSDGIIVKKKLETISDGVRDPNVYTLSDEYNSEDKMQQFFEKLSQFRKSTLVKTNSMGNIRKTLLSDFPFMAKM